MEHDRILGYFLEEASEHLNTIEQGLRKLPETVKQPTMIRELFRAAHSIKGSAAMLGLLDIQKIGNQFEANFKLLKEQPQIAVDNQLQSLFLESFGFLQAGINDVKGSSDPYRRDPATPDPIGDPVFEELKSYLQHLLAIANPAPIENRDLDTHGERLRPRDPAIEQVFGEYVTRKLDEIIALCLQAEQPETRTQIQQICQKLGNLGGNFDFLEWTNLFAACRLAIANPANPLPQLGESITIAVKQAQVLVLAGRDRAIGITPDLEALINRHRQTPVNSLTTGNLATSPASTWKLDNPNDPFAGIESDLESTTHKLDQSADLLSISHSSDLFAGAPVDAEALELNAFMNLLGQEVPTEGTWMQDDDFFDREISLKDLGDSATDKFYQQIFEPVVPGTPADRDLDLAIAIGSPADIGTYDEETFYTPDLGDINDLEIANFWSDTELAAVQHTPLYTDLDLIGQLQPDLSPTLDSGDISGPDFSLDRPMSELFPTIAAPDNLAEQPEVDPIVPESMAPDRSLLQSPSLPAERLEPQNFELQNHDQAEVSNGIASSTSDVLCLEELTSNNSPESSNLLFLEELNGEKLPEPTLGEDLIATELNNWIDNSIDQNDVDLFGSLDLDNLNCDELGPDLAIGDRIGDLDLDAKLAITADAVDQDFGDLDLKSFGSNNLDFNLFDNDFVGLDFDLNSNNFTGLESNDRDFGDLDLDLDSALGDDFGDLDLDLVDRSEPFLGLNLIETTTTEVDRELVGLNLNQLNVEIATPGADQQLNIDPADRDFTDLELDNLDHSDPIVESSISNDFTDLDLNVLTEENLNFDQFPPATFEDLSELDFNLDQLSADLAPDELTDLESMLGATAPTETFTQSGLDLGADGDLDTLLNSVALGVGSDAILTGAESVFDDLDALMLNPAPTADPTANLDDLDRLLVTATPVANPPTVDRKPTERRAKQRTFEQTMRVSVRHLDNLNNLVGELVVNRNTLEQDQNRMRQFVEKLLSEVQKLNEVGKRMQDLYERSLMENSLVASRQQYKPTTPTALPTGSEGLDASGILMEYDPLEMDRFTPIHLLSQKMIELTVRVRESTADIEFVVDGSTEVTRTLRQITGQLQEDLTKSRMVPFAQTADRLQRGVRDNGLKYGKQVELTVEGRDTLIDKVILESLTDPLIHMVNNAIAHGIESIADRQLVGKPADGKITIRALHQGNQTIISISDDGAGINTEQVKTKAIEKGIITAQQAATMTKQEAYELLFLPSFSTKDQADELSGRGVGMDVVKTSITDIRGTITTESQLGVGTTFTIRLPLALSIAKALIAVNNKSNIAFPMDGIEDTQDVSPEQIQTNTEGKPCIFWRDELIPFTPLSDLLGFNRPLARNNFYSTTEDDSDLVSILILRSDGNLTAIQVDKITGDQEIVIKPLQGPAAKPLGVAGATVMGDGRIIPIADVMELIALANGTLSRHVSTQWTTQMTAPTVEMRESMVLIVDDSITVRELLSLTFKRAGYRVEQARDGQEAWDKLRAGLPCDIVFCDIEMPRMDGLEFLSRIQKDTALSKVPVAMLTSRGSDRHRQIAAQLGASGYFIKPYLEEALLDAAKRMIKGEVLEIV
jgi:chemotaxis protein histidine kinase CheA/ActR/RegA family two-component response regulator